MMMVMNLLNGDEYTCFVDLLFLRLGNTIFINILMDLREVFRCSHIAIFLHFFRKYTYHKKTAVS